MMSCFVEGTNCKNLFRWGWLCRPSYIFWGENSPREVLQPVCRPSSQPTDNICSPLLMCPGGKEKHVRVLSGAASFQALVESFWYLLSVQAAAWKAISSTPVRQKGRLYWKTTQNESLRIMTLFVKSYAFNSPAVQTHLPHFLFLSAVQSGTTWLSQNASRWRQRVTSNFIASNFQQHCIVFPSCR